MSPIRHHIKRAAEVLRASPLVATRDHQTKHAVMQFAKKAGLVYFGSASLSAGDTRLVGGVTLASVHKDAHYCLGAHDGYDITCVQRLSDVSFPGKKSVQHAWVVMQFDLHSASPLPHVLIGRKDQAQLVYDNFLEIHRDMQPHVFSVPDEHKKEYVNQYVTYSPPAHAHTVDFLLSPEFTSAVVGHFKNMMIEVEGDSLYLFVDHARPSAAFLNKMMHYGLLVARHIDERMGAK